MSYQEQEIPKEKLEKYIQVLDSDEGIRIDNKTSLIFINKTARRYCINTSKNGHDEFIYKNNPAEVMSFLADKMDSASKSFAY